MLDDVWFMCMVLKCIKSVILEVPMSYIPTLLNNILYDSRCSPILNTVIYLCLVHMNIFDSTIIKITKYSV